MPNKKAPSLEEAKLLFESQPNKTLTKWSSEWGVSIERVRQIKEECGFKTYREPTPELIKEILERIEMHGFVPSSRELFKDLPIGPDKFKTWLLNYPEIKDKVDKANASFLSVNKTSKKCYKCEVTKDLAEYIKSQKYKDGYNRYCNVCLDEIKNQDKSIKTKDCWFCQKNLSVGSFNAKRTSPDGYSHICKSCQSKERRKKRLKTNHNT